ncbi:MAG: NAD(P)H-dependent oxidoreductase [Firmicutes bacterium]|nr:NAD(P)H-dependent oxidoreductase [Bacillota bacterium]
MDLSLLIVVGSTRPGRVGLPIAQWVESRARAHGKFAVHVADLAEIPLPLFNEPYHPKLGRYVHEHTKAWSAMVDPADAFIFVSPEYNYGFSAALKNAIDYLHREWQFKPVGFVSYGGVAAGTRAVQMLKQVVTTLKMVPLYDAVAIPWVDQLVVDGVFTPTPALEEAAQRMLDELHRWAVGLKHMRES